MSEMMKPVAWRYTHEGKPIGLHHRKTDRYYALDGKFIEAEPLYTAAQLQEAARHAMERAAQACLEQASKASVTATDTRDPAFHMIDHAAITRCVNAIRALADVAGEKGVGK